MLDATRPFATRCRSCGRRWDNPTDRVLCCDPGYVRVRGTVRRELEALGALHVDRVFDLFVGWAPVARLQGQGGFTRGPILISGRFLLPVLPDERFDGSTR